MLKKALITAALGAAVVGGGTAALAASGDHAATTPTQSQRAVDLGRRADREDEARRQEVRQARRQESGRTRLGRALHGTWVTKNAKTNAVVTHDAIRGTVSAVTSTSITVKAADGVSQTYTVAGSTKVLKRTATTKAPTNGQTTPAKGHKAAPSTIGAVKVGDKAAVVGTGTTSLKATHIVDGLAK